jgi:hypothetical protein
VKLPSLGVIPIGWRVSAVLAALLGLSAWLNLHQHDELVAAPLAVKIDAQSKALDDSAALLKSDHERARVLGIAADKATAKLDDARRDYDTEAAKQPLGIQCAPGAGRQRVVNRALGAPAENVK